MASSQLSFNHILLKQHRRFQVLLCIACILTTCGKTCEVYVGIQIYS